MRRRTTESSDFLIVVGMSLCQRNLSVAGADFERGRAALKHDDSGAGGRVKKERECTRESRVKDAGGRIGTSEEQKREKNREAFALTLISALPRCKIATALRAESSDSIDAVARDIGYSQSGYYVDLHRAVVHDTYEPGRGSPRCDGDRTIGGIAILE